MSTCEGIPFLLFLADEDEEYPKDPYEDFVEESSRNSEFGENTSEDSNLSDEDSEDASVDAKGMPGDVKVVSGNDKDVSKDVKDASEDAEKPKGLLAGSSFIKGYALISQAFKNKYPKVLSDLERNHIFVIPKKEKGSQTNLNAGFIVLAETYRLKLFEAELRNVETDTGPSTSSTYSRIFVNAYSRSRSNSVPDWLKNTYGDFLNLTHFDCKCFYKAIEKEILDVIEEALSFPILRFVEVTYGHHKGGSFLHFAIKRHQTALVELLLNYWANKEAGRDDEEPIYGDEYEYEPEDEEEEQAIKKTCSTPLFMAAKKGFSDIVEVLLRYGAKHNTYIEESPLSIAFSNNHLEAFRLLMEAETKTNTNTYKNETISRILLFSVTKHRPNFVELILRHFPVPRNESNKLTFYYAFLTSEASTEQMQCFEKMKEHGFRIEYENIENSSMLLCGAIINDWAGVVQRLLGGGADVHQVCNVFRLKPLPTPTGSHLALLPRDVGSTNPAGDDILQAHSVYTPLHLAAAFAGEAVVQLLISHGADVDLKLGERTPVYDACRTHNLNALKCLIANGASVENDPELIRHAADFGHPQIMELLLLNRTPSGFESIELAGFLARAAARQNVEVMNVLFKFGAQPNAGFTVNCARGCRTIPEGNHNETIRCLLDHSFNNVEWVLDATKMIGFLDKYARDPTCSNCNTCIRSCFNLLARHIIKLESANLMFIDQNVASFWHSDESLDEFRSNCEAEMERLKNEKVRRSNITYHDVLTKSADRLACYARHKHFVETMTRGEYSNTFPIYGSVLNCQFQKGYHRWNQLKRGSEICGKLSKCFKELPNIVKEQIVKYLNSYNLEVLGHEFDQFERNTDENKIFPPPL